MSSSRDKKPVGGIRTLADLNRRPDPGSDNDSEGPPEYYTGGEKSYADLNNDPFKCIAYASIPKQGLIFRGMLVQDPSKANDVDSIFSQARQLGAVEEPMDHIRPSSSRSFTGTGRLLSGERAQAAPQQPESFIYNIVFWRNGFTVNDGPLRRMDDPENASFLESIKKSECPKELEPADKKSSVHVSLHRRDENYPEPEKRSVPFQGVGRTLGRSSDGSTNQEASESATSPAPLTTAPLPSRGLVVDDTLASTSIQLRLADGTRMVARFNHHHTVSDIRAFIDASRPGGTRNYQLQTSFPPKPLTDVNQTIEQAGLANSVIIQKL